MVTLSARHDVREGVGRKIFIICNLGLIRCAADRSYNHLISFILRLSVRFCTNRVVTPLSDPTDNRSLSEILTGRAADLHMCVSDFLTTFRIAVTALQENPCSAE
ncbi:MAG: hypothetical protein QOF70_2363 [Acetobacteraceae bacterium]|nr:hypothetical protein [Acetobacteraceae bacterium]